MPHTYHTNHFTKFQPMIFLLITLLFLSFPVFLNCISASKSKKYCEDEHQMNVNNVRLQPLYVFMHLYNITVCLCLAVSQILRHRIRYICICTVSVTINETNKTRLSFNVYLSTSYPGSFLRISNPGSQNGHDEGMFIKLYNVFPFHSYLELFLVNLTISR